MTHDLDDIVSRVDGEITQKVGRHLNEPQRRALKSILASGYGTIQMPTGCGKTRLISAFIRALTIDDGIDDKYKLKNGDKILFLTPRVVLRRQAVEEEFKKVLSGIIKITNIEPDKLVKKESVKPWERKPRQQFGRDKLLECLENVSNIILCALTPHTLASYYHKYGFSNVERIKILIGDEGHYFYCGKRSSNIIRKFIEEVRKNQGYVIALTATPVKDTVELFGPLRYRLSSSEAMRMGILTSMLKLYPYVTRTEIHHMESLFMDEVWRFAVKQRAVEYSSRIVDILKSEAIENGFSLEERVPKTLVVSANTREAGLLAESLRTMLDGYGKSGVVYEAHTGVDSDKPAETAHRALEHFKREAEGIIVTVDMARLGFDDRNLEALVIARRVSSPTAYIQMRGRVLRRPDADLCIKNQKDGKGGYAIIIALHYDRDFEGELEIIERWESLESSQKVRSDLSGFRGEVKIVDGEVEVFELPPKIIAPGQIQEKKRENLMKLIMRARLALARIRAEKKREVPQQCCECGEIIRHPLDLANCPFCGEPVHRGYYLNCLEKHSKICFGNYSRNRL